MKSRAVCPQTSLFDVWGEITEIAPGLVKIAGISHIAGVGDSILIDADGGDVRGEVLRIAENCTTALLFEACDPVRIGDKARLRPGGTVAPGDHWLGCILDHTGENSASDRLPQPIGVRRMRLVSPAPPAAARRGLGPRLATGWMATDTLLPICRGQRIGLFAGSGVGKSTFLAALASGLQADRVVIALIGERSREVSDFAHRLLPEAIASKAVIIAATSSESPAAKKSAAYCAMAAAERFRDEGHSVLLLMDSLTRFAEAHRETALLAGETPGLQAYPPSTARAIAELVERAGPGVDGAGDITAVFSVLVAGSDMDEPVADMVRGLIDGHIVLSRDIAQRGRYPAIDVVRSVSRSLPGAASAFENALISDARAIIATYETLEPMIRADLYEPGQDARADRAVTLFEAVDSFIASRNPEQHSHAFEQLRAILDRGETASAGDAAEKEVLARQPAETDTA